MIKLLKRAWALTVAIAMLIGTVAMDGGALVLCLLLAIGIPALYIGGIVFAVVWVLKLTGVL